jgi:precorrin-4/cobalt-precorrin-4 C11-methyltransferase
VLHLAITQAEPLMAQLAGDYGADCPVIVVYRASQPGELIVRGTVATIAAQVRAAGLRQAAVILVGRALDPRHPCATPGESYLYDPRRDRASKQNDRASGP